MSYLPLDVELRPLAEIVERHPEGIGIAEIQASAAPLLRRTLNRRLARLVEQGRIQRRGAARHARYFPVAPPPSTAESRFAVAELAPQAYVPLADDAQRVRSLIQRPVSQRAPVGYKRDFLDAYESNKTHYLEEKASGIRCRRRIRFV